MFRPFALLAAAALAFAPQAALANFNASDAKAVCQSAAKAEFRAGNANQMSIAYRSGSTFTVRGVAHKSGSSIPFLCEIRKGRVTRIERTRDEEIQMDGKTAAAVLVGALVIGALSNDHQHENHKSSSHSSASGDHYSPHNGIVCYPRKQACFKLDLAHGERRFNRQWTEREFGSSASSAPKRVSERDMARYCIGEASAKFHEKPQRFLTLPVERSGGGYVVYGQYPREGKHVTTFTCRFNGNREFVRVNRT